MHQTSPKPAAPTGKSQLVGFVLTFLFGPLGLLYSAPVAAVLLLVGAVLTGFLTFGLSALLFWPISILWSIVAVSLHNQQHTQS